MVKDQSKHFQVALQNAVNLAKMINGSVDLLYVKSPSQVASFDNQLAALRELHQESDTARKTMKDVVDLITASEQIPITYNLTFGNIINEVQQHINKTRPDIIVVGKRRTKITNLFGVDLTTYLLKNYQGALFISGEEKALSSPDDLALGSLDDLFSKNKSKLSGDLARRTSKPITFLKINSTNKKEKPSPSTMGSNEATMRANMTTFEFDHTANISESVSKYVERSGVSLLCVQKSKLLDLNKEIKNVNRQIQKTVEKTNTPVLVLEN